MMEVNKIYQGDCLELMKQIKDKSVDMILCDLPYGVTARNKWDVIIPFNKLWEQYNRIIKDNGVIVLTSIQPFTSLCVMSNPEMFKYEWIWEKQQGTGFLNAKKQPLRNHESILVFYKKQPTYNPQFTKGKPYKCTSGKGSKNYREQKQVLTINNGERYPLTVQKFQYDGKKEHPTQKPIALFEYLIKTYTNEGDLVLDNCIGSGTTAICCKGLNRKFIGMELSEEYFKIAQERLSQSILTKTQEGGNSSQP